MKMESGLSQCSEMSSESGLQRNSSRKSLDSHIANDCIGCVYQAYSPMEGDYCNLTGEKLGKEKSCLDLIY